MSADWYATHKAVIAYGQIMYLAGRFRGAGNLELHSRALELSVITHRRILSMVQA